MQGFFLSNSGTLPLARPAATLSRVAWGSVALLPEGESAPKGRMRGHQVFHSYQHYQQCYAHPEEWALTCCNFELSRRECGGNFEEFA